MAKRFPSSRTISPSVRIIERDFSHYGYGPSLNKTAIVGFASKGPLNEPITIRTPEDLFRVFGYPDPDFPGYLIYSCLDYLREGCDLIVVRVAEIDFSSEDFARTSYEDVPSAGTEAELITFLSDQYFDEFVVGEFILPSPRYIRLKANGSPSARTLVVPAETPITSITGEEESSLLNILSSQIKDEDGFAVIAKEFAGEEKLAFRSTINGPNSKLEIVSCAFNLYNEFSNTGDFSDEEGAGEAKPLMLGIGYGMNKVVVQGLNSSYNSSVDGEFNLSIHRNLFIEIVVTGSGNDEIDGIPQKLYLPRGEDGSNHDCTIATIADYLNGKTDETYTTNPNNPKGLIFGVNGDNLTITLGDRVTLTQIGDPGHPYAGEWYYTGNEARVVVRPTSTGDYPLGLDNRVHKGNESYDPAIAPVEFTDFNNGMGEQDEDYKSYTEMLTNSPTALAPYEVLASIPRFRTSEITGTEVTNVDATFRIFASNPGTAGNLTQVIVDVDIDTARFSLEVIHRGVEVENWTEIHKFENHPYDSVHYIEKFINGFSDYIRIENDSSTSQLPKPGIYQLGSTKNKKGSDGIPVDPARQDELIVGDPIFGTGLQTLSEPERIDVDIVIVPGISSTEVIRGLKSLCEDERADCMFILDPPFGMTPLEVKKWHNGQHPLNTIKFNSNYGALYWPWIKQRDNINKLDVWVPPSGTMAAIYARTDAVAYPWYAPAGLRRGKIEWAIETEYMPYLKERDSLYSFDNTVNTFTNFPLEGVVAWGQKTMQRYPSALDRVNVRRLMLYLEKTIKKLSRYFLFEPHTVQTREAFITMCDTILGSVKSSQGLYDYIVICDESLNTPAVIDRNEMRARIGVQPVKAIEFIFIEFTIHRTGSFSTDVLQQSGLMPY